MGMIRFVGGPVDGKECFPIVPRGGNGHYRIYFGFSEKNGQWQSYHSDTPYWKPRKIARYNMDYDKEPGVYYFKRFEWIDRTETDEANNGAKEV